MKWSWHIFLFPADWFWKIWSLDAFETRFMLILWCFVWTKCIHHDPLIAFCLLLTVLVTDGGLGGDSSRIISPSAFVSTWETPLATSLLQHLHPLLQSPLRVPLFVHTHTQSVWGYIYISLCISNYSRWVNLSGPFLLSRWERRGYFSLFFNPLFIYICSQVGFPILFLCLFCLNWTFASFP